MGLPGSGKTTVSRVLAAHTGGSVFCAGDLLRDRAARGDGVASAIITAGTSLSGEQFRELLMFHERHNARRPLIIDGGPRNVEQVAVLRDSSDGPALGLWLDLDPGEALPRLRARVNGESRLDDELALLAGRLRRQAAALAETVAAWTRLWPLERIDARQSQRDVAAFAVSRLASSASPTAVHLTRPTNE
jgi:adenylate kinase family enzyme